MTQNKVKTLGALCDILDSKRRPVTKKDRLFGIYPYYGATGILDYVEGYIFDEPLVLVGEDGAKWGEGENTAFKVAGKCWVNNHAHVIRPHRDIVLDDWIIYYLNANDLSSFITGLTVPKLNQAKLREIPIPLPTLPEQKRIVAILDEAFEGINMAVVNAETNLANARELFNSYLNSVFDDEADHTLLSDLATDITDGDHSPPPKADSGIPFVTISDVIKSTRTIDFSDTFFVPNTYFQNLKINKKPRHGDILYTVTGATLGIPVLVRQDIDFCFQRHIGLIRPKQDINSTWLSYALLSRCVFNQATAGSTGAAQKTVSLSVLRNIKVPRTAIMQQLALAGRLDALFAETQRLEALYHSKLALLEELRQAILQKAFAGALIDVPKELLPEAAE